MKFNTAVGFTFSGIALLSLNNIGKRNARSYAIAASILVLIIGFLTVSEYLLHFNVAFDELFIKDNHARINNELFPGRMAFATAVCFALTGIAFLFQTSKNLVQKKIAQYLLHAVSVLSFIMFTGYVYGVPEFYHLVSSISSTIYTVVVFLFLSAVASFLNPELGLTGIFTGNLIGNKVARNLLPIVLFAVFSMGLFRLRILQKEMLSLSLGLSLNTLSVIFVSIFIIWYISSWLNKIDVKRANAEATIIELNRTLEKKVEKRSAELSRTLEQLQLSEIKFRTAFEYSAIGMAIVSLKGEWIRVNIQLCKILGYTELELLNRPFLDFTHPDDIDDSMELLTLLQSGLLDTYRRQKRYIHKNGSIIWINLSVSVAKDQDGEPLYLISQIEDITERKIAKEKLAESEAQLRLFVEHSPAALAMLDKDMRYMIVSERWKTDYNLGKEQIIGKTHYEVFPELPQHWNDVHQRCMQGAIETSDEDSFVRLDGRREWLKWEIRPWYKASGEIGGIIMFTEVITDHKQAKYMLNERIKELTTLSRFSQMLQSENKSIDALFQELVTLIPAGFQHSETCAARIVFDGKQYTTPNYTDASWRLSAEFQTSKNRKGLVEVVCFEQMSDEAYGPFLVEERNMIILLSEMLQGFINRKLEADALQKSEANLKTIFDNTDVGYLLLDDHLNIVSYNASYEKMYARKEDNFKFKEKKHALEIFRKERHEIITNNFNNVLKNGVSLDYEVDYSYINKCPCFYLIKMNPIKDDSHKVIGICLSAQNITKRKQTDLEKEKMSHDLLQRNRDLEQFAYIISHNLRAPVANILGLSGLINGELPKEEHEYIINGIVNSTERLDVVINDLNNVLQIRKGITESKETVSFSKLIDDVKFDLSKIIATNNVQIITDFKEANQYYTIKSYLYSVLYNLISNSIKYCQPGKPPVIYISSARYDQSIVLRVKDNGLGIDMNKHGHQLFGLYKRFHSNVEGKGMGLFMTKTQVETMGGSIEVQSQLNIGTEFIITLN